jgi:hypothetical protein
LSAPAHQRKALNRAVDATGWRNGRRSAGTSMFVMPGVAKKAAHWGICVDRIQNAAELVELLALKDALVAHVRALPHARAIPRLSLLACTQARGKRTKAKPHVL